MLQVVPAGISGEIGGDAKGAMRGELDWIVRNGEAYDRPITFLVMESGRHPDEWRGWFDEVRAANAQEHGQPNSTNGLDLAVNSELYDNASQSHRDDNGLEAERNRGRYIQVRRILDVGLPGDGERKHERVKCKNIHQSRKTVLIQLEKAQEHQ